MKLKEWQCVPHSKCGWGTILEHDGNQMTVYFHTVGVRKYAVSQAVFEVVESEGAKKKAGV